MLSNLTQLYNTLFGQKEYTENYSNIATKNKKMCDPVHHILNALNWGLFGKSEISPKSDKHVCIIDIQKCNLTWKASFTGFHKKIKNLKNNRKYW